MISIKSEQEIELMRKSGEITYGALMGLKDFIKPGVTTKEIDKFVYDYIISHDATPSFLGYEGFPATACVSINNMVVHGIPDNTKLKKGDIVTVDVGSIYKGLHSDSAYTYIVGSVDKKTLKFVNDTRDALYKGISVIKEGIKLNEVCKAIESVAKENGYGVFDCLTGHGVGRELHEDPFIPNLSNHESEGIILKAGMTLAIEPMFSLGTKNVWLIEDNWGIITRDGSLAAHFEHTILVTKDGYEILTGE
jgi:methionyl aminopeptidase